MNIKNQQIRLDNLSIKKIICNDKKIQINKPIKVFSKTKLDLNFLKINIFDCKHVEITDNKFNKNYLVKIDSLNSNYNFKEFKNYKPDLFLTYFNKENNNLFLKNNETLLNENLFIPKDMNVIIKPGQKLILTNNSFIISNSRWLADGSDLDKKIIVTGLKNNYGGGIMINNPNQKSYFNNVQFSYLGGYKKDLLDETNLNNEFTILGALNFYKTDVELTNVNFKKITSEDALNIINSKFFIENIEFNENNSDGIDFDFSDGNIKDAKFINIGNDAIDFSGSNAKISNIYFDNVQDKLVSVGENSKIKISDFSANNSYIGIASKDGSTVTGSNIFMKNVKLPFVSFNKKFEYESALMYLNDININKFYEKWVTDSNSKIYFNNSQVGKISKNIIPIVYNKDLKLLKKN